MQVVVAVLHGREALDQADLAGELFEQLALQRYLWRFARLKLAAGELPEAGQRATRPAATRKHPAMPIFNQRADNLDHAAIQARLTRRGTLKTSRRFPRAKVARPG